MKRIFITGGTGFFGKSMLDWRLRHPEVAVDEWTILSRDPGRFVKRYPGLAKQPGVRFRQGDVRTFTLGDKSYDAVIHAATDAVTTLTDEEMTSVVVEGTRHVIDFAKACGAQKLMLTSSGAVYGSLAATVSEETPCCPTTAYGKGKFLAEQICCESGLHVLLPRCFAFVGPYLNRGIHFAIGNFIQNCIDGQPIVIKGDGSPLRSLCPEIHKGVLLPLLLSPLTPFSPCYLFPALTRKKRNSKIMVAMGEMQITPLCVLKGYGRMAAL